MNKVKGYRVGCNLTQQEMADAIGISVRTYARLENKPSGFTLEQMTKFVNKINELNPDLKLEDIFLD